MTWLTLCLALLFASWTLAAGADDGSLPELQAPSFSLPSAWHGDLDGMRERRLIRVGTAFSRTHYFLDGLTQRGLTYDLLQQFEEFLNRELETPKALPVRILIVPMPRDRLLPALAAGHLDIVAANLTITPERSETVAFAAPFGVGTAEVVVLGPESPALASLDDLAGTTAYLRESSSYWLSVEALNRSLVERGLAPVLRFAVDAHLEDEDLLEMVAAGILPYAIVDEHKARFWADVIDGLTLREDLALREGAAIAWALRKNTSELQALVDRFVPDVKAGSLTGNILLKRYLRDNPWVRNPGATVDRKRFEAVMHLFQEYAGRYGFDWLLVAAQAYQESRIDQTARSPAGAIGIMQLLPSTAADPAVGIPDISTEESNIHAGTRYLRVLVDQYLADPELDDLNRTLLAFAAYNAGPGNLNRIRNRAAEMDLDPNRWFGHAELAAAKLIGRETVTYVSNIAKYYFAFRLIAERIEERERARQAVETP
ncbi:transglycosylase [Thioalkalivibrio paradoxus ARh 1]|uniref:Transglycosylase n=1 Tax=Thioalkalivibrio paradoxus ARh 1 TaxID=713585 RepID=W0DMX8_9GAMM|nr:transglycosylase [Thioalkalivibrio paradoxus ARh 1]